MSTQTLRVRYNRSILEACRESRLTHWDFAIDDAAFPATAKETQLVTLEFLKLEADVKPAGVIEELAGRSLRPANIRELLAFAQETLEHDLVLIALGSKYFYPYGYWLCPYLYLNQGRRELRLHRSDRVIGKHCVIATIVQETP